MTASTTAPGAPLIEIIDVGASEIDGLPEYEPLLSTGMARVTGFDIQALRDEAVNRRYFRALIGDGARHIYFAYASPGLNSLLEMNPVLCASDKRATLLSRTVVSTTRLDDISEIERVDLLKLDCQGSELMVLAGARKLLSRCVLVQIELSFYPLYLEQPALGTLDLFLREQGFLPHSLISHRTMDSGHWIDADFLYAKRSALCDSDQESIKWEIIRQCYSSSSPRFSGFTAP